MMPGDSGQLAFLVDATHRKAKTFQSRLDPRRPEHFSVFFIGDTDLITVASAQRSAPYHSPLDGSAELFSMDGDDGLLPQLRLKLDSQTRQTSVDNSDLTSCFTIFESRRYGTMEPDGITPLIGGESRTWLNQI